MTENKRLRGKVRRYKPHFGFITAEDGSDHFVGGARLLESGIPTVYAGDILEFSIGIGRNGRPEAVDIKVLKSAGIDA